MTHAAIRLLPGSLYDRMMIALGPVAWWKLADPVGASTAKDSSGNGYDGTVNGGVTFGQPGPISGTPGDTAALFDGSTGYIATALNPAYPAFSVVSWIRITALPTSLYAVTANDDPTAHNKGVRLALDTNAHPAFALGNGSTYAQVNPGTPLSLTSWNLVTGTWDGSTISLYLGQSLIASQAFTGSLASGTDALWIGNNPIVSEFFPGDIAQVAIFNAALTPTQIAELYQLGQYSLFDSYVASYGPNAWWKLNEPAGSTTAADSSGNGNTLTNAYTPIFGVPGPIPGETAFQTNSTEDYLYTLNNYNPQFPNGFTLSLWFYPLSAQSGAVMEFYNNYYGPYNQGIRLAYEVNTGGIVANVGNGGNSTTLVGTAPPLNQWSFISLTYDASGNVILQQNNITTGIANIGLGTVMAEASDISININKNTPYITGNTAQVVVFPQPLSSTQLSNLWHSVKGFPSIGFSSSQTQQKNFAFPITFSMLTNPIAKRLVKASKFITSSITPNSFASHSHNYPIIALLSLSSSISHNFIYAKKLLSSFSSHVTTSKYILSHKKAQSSLLGQTKKRILPSPFSTSVSTSGKIQNKLKLLISAQLLTGPLSFTNIHKSFKSAISGIAKSSSHSNRTSLRLATSLTVSSRFKHVLPVTVSAALNLVSSTKTKITKSKIVSAILNLNVSHTKNINLVQKIILSLTTSIDKLFSGNNVYSEPNEPEDMLTGDTIINNPEITQ